MLNQKGQLCNAGYNVCIITTKGNIVPCYKIHKRIGNIYKKIEFNDKLIRCPFKTCYCPLNIYDPYLFEKAKKEVKSDVMPPIFFKMDLLIDGLGAVAKSYLPHVIIERIRNLAGKIEL